MIPMHRLEWLAEIAGEDDERVQRIMSRAVKWPESRVSGEKLLLRIAKRKGRKVGVPAIYPIPDGLPKEGLVLGTCLDGTRRTEVQRRLRPEALPQHLLIAGASGSGKTRAAGLLVQQLIARGTKVSIFDSCGDYLGMIRELPVEDLLVFRGRSTPLNPFVVPCPGLIDPLDWIETTGSLYWETQHFRAGSGGLLTDIVGHEYFKRSVFDGSEDFPTFGDIYQAVLDRKYSSRQQRHSGWAETLRHRFGVLVRQLGRGLCGQRSMRPEELLNHSVIFDVRGLRGMSLDFLVGLVVLELRAYLQVHPELVLEEAHRMLGKRKEDHQEQEPILVEAARMVRGLSMGLIALDQAPALLPEAYLANMGSVMLMRLVSRRGAQGVGGARGLTEAQVDQLPKLAPRTGVVQCVDVTEPCLVEIPFFPGWECPPEAEVQARVDASMKRVGCEEAGGEVRRLLGLAREKDDQKQDEDQLRGDPLQVLAHICRGPALIERRCEELQITRGQEGRARQTLEKLGLIQEGDRLGRWVLYEPTAKGRAVAEERGFTVARFKSGAGHEFMARGVQETVGRASTRVTFLSAGQGFGIGGVQPDLIARISDEHGDMSRVVALQICSKNKDKYEIQKIRELLDIQQVDVVIVVTRDKGARDRLTKRLAREGLFVQAAAGVGSPHGELPAAVHVVDLQNAIGDEADWSWLLEA